tara:strand:- start:137 stop:2746 length:2610 start_codon:yes stop_codon:yes gene_type:complete
MAQGTLTNLAIKDTYKSLLKIGAANGTDAAANTNILHATDLKIVEDGDGNNSPIQIAQNRLKIVPSAANHANAFEVSQEDGTQILNVASDTPAVTMTSTLTLSGNADFNGDLDVDGTANLDVVDIDGAVDMASTLTLAGNADFNGDLDVDGTTNLDAVDIDGAVQLDNTLIVGVDDTGYDVKFFGATATNGYMLWDESTDALILGSASKIGIGDTSPQALLSLRGDATNTSQPDGLQTGTDVHTALHICNIGDAVNEKYGMQFGCTDNYSFGGIFGVGLGTSGNTWGAITFDMRASNSATALTEVMRVNYDGKVGIGNTDPQGKLHVGGSISSPSSDGDNIIFPSDIGLETVASSSSNGYGFKFQSTDDGSGQCSLRLYSRADNASWEDEIMQFVTSTNSNEDGCVGIGGDPNTATLYVNGDVGIGTNSPDYLLDVENASGHSKVRIHAGTDSSAQLLLQNDAQIWNVNCQTSDKFAIYDDTADVERLVILSSTGRVGIGTTAPASNFAVSAGNSPPAGSSSVVSINVGDDATYHDGDALLHIKNSGNRGAISHANGSHLLRCDYSDACAFIINEDGHIGMGEASPTNLLHLTATTDDNADSLAEVDTESELRIQYLAAEEASMYFGGLGSTRGYIQGADDDGSHAYDICINPYGGHVGIGTSAPTQKLEVVDNHATDILARLFCDNTADTTHALKIQLKHNTPTATNIFTSFWDIDSQIDTMQGDDSGGVNFTGAADDTYSDRRVKTDIADLTGSLEKINAIKPRTYKYTDEFLNQSFQDYTIKDWQKKTQMGFVAQELGEVFPDILQPTTHTVQKDNITYDGKVYNTGDEIEIIKTCWGRRGTMILFSNLIKAVQELSAKVTALENN